MNIAKKLSDIKQDIPESVRLVAVSKFHPISAIMETYDAGQRIFGESRMQEFEAKHQELPSDIEWHFIGHLQRNKVKNVLPFIHTIHSLDSERLWDEIDKRASSIEKEVSCLLQIHIAEEESKYGFKFAQCKEFLRTLDLTNNKHAYIGGIMAMATNTDDENQIRKEFKVIKNFFEELKDEFFKNDPKFKEISMGMSQDYKIAIEEGATLIRVGSSIFGEREY